MTYNVVARKPDPSSNVTGSVTLHGKPGGSSSDSIKIGVGDVNIFDGSKWHISFGRDKKDELGHSSSSYYLRVGKSNYNTAPTMYTASMEFGDRYDNSLNVVTPDYNASGTFIAVGSQSMSSHASYTFLNNDTNANCVDFTGKVSNIRFFSKALSPKETISHIENPFSLGVDNPNVNFNFNTSKSGSFERLRLDYGMNQTLTESNTAGSMDVIDFSQNNKIGTTFGFESSKPILKPERHDYRTLVSKLETQSNDNKVRIRSFKSSELADKYNTSLAPVYKIPPAEKPNDDRRVAIEVSTVQALNDDISLIFSSLDYFDNAIGDPELVFSSEYRDLRDMRRVYFNRLDDKVSFVKFFSFFKWFDDSVGDILEELIPTTSRYLGTNFVIESHALERPKFTYMYTDMYLGELERPEPGKIFVQQLIGSIRKR